MNDVKTNGKNRMQRFREKIKQNKNKWEEHKEKNRERMRKYRAKLKNEAKKDIKKDASKEQTKKNTERMRRWRAKKKYLAEHPELNCIPYQSKKSFLAAVSRVRKCLPDSLYRKRLVIKQLCDEFYPEMSSKLSKLENQMKIDHSAIQEEKALHTKVVKFYNEDYISYEAPDKSDVVSVQVKNTKILMQKRYMIMSMNEAYKIYCNEIDDEADKIERSKFFQLRPQNVSERPNPLNYMNT